MVCDQRRDRGIQFFGGGDIQQKEKVQAFGFAGRTPPPLPPKFPPLVEHPDLSIKKSLTGVFGLLIVMILKRVSKSIFFQSNEFRSCEVKDEKVVANSLMAFNLLKIIHPFQSKKPLRTY